MDDDFDGKTAIMTSARLAYADLLSNRDRRQLRRDAAAAAREFLGWLRTFHGSQLFGTGPSIASIDHGPDVSFTGGPSGDDRTLRVACNSLVSNTSLFEAISPHVITFGDPAFHFGDSEYARTFREDVARVMRLSPELRLVLPLEFYPLVGDQLAEFGARVVPCPIGPPGFFSARAFQSRCTLLRTGNIATSAMIPIARVAGRRMEFFGFDGRRADDKGFWRHSISAQYSELYETVRTSHPSFFRDTKYVAYYEQHCRRLSRMVRGLEREGIEVLSRTPSEVPCLRERYANSSHTRPS